MNAKSRREGLAQEAAGLIRRRFEEYRRAFSNITRRAQLRFEERDWHGMQQDAVERLELYGSVVTAVVGEIRSLLGESLRHEDLWRAIKTAYSQLVSGRADAELAETFFNSSTRRIFTTVGVNPRIEFVAVDFHTVPPVGTEPVHRTYHRSGSTEALTRRILTDGWFSAPYRDLNLDAELAAREIDAGWCEQQGSGSFEVVEILDFVFYRRKGAYLIGRLREGKRIVPIIFALVSRPEGIGVDAVLLTENEASIVFSFTRSYFHVDVDRPWAVIQFIKTLLPLKPIAELYISLGYNKHGKTERYRELLRYVRRSDDRFVIAPGDPGMVMVVFTLPPYDVVFKVIRDRFPPPKSTTRAKVRQQYQLVFRHDRAGRLVDAQEFEHLAFARHRFSDEVLAELVESASRSVAVQGGEVAIRHLYTERRVTPLNLYLRTAEPQAAQAAVLDYGQAIKELAATNVFPGDLLLKNFGVTRHGRVIFYDYDELCLLTECKFRRLPEPRSDYEELAPEPWFWVGENDIFPEELLTFLDLHGDLRETFLRAHSDLFDVEFWRNQKRRHEAGEVPDVFPYPQERRLHPD